MINIHVADPEKDYDAAARLISRYQNQAITGDDIREWDERRMEGMIRRRTVAVTEAGQVAGCSTMMHESWDPPGKFYVWLCVDAAAIRQGIGSQLYNDALAFCRSHGATQFTSQVNDNDLTSQAFAQRRGFHQDQGCSKVIYETIKQRESITEELLQAGHNTDDAHQEPWDLLDSAE